MFKGTTQGKRYFLSQLESLKPEAFALQLKNAVAATGRRPPEIEFSLTSSPWPEVDSSLVASTQAELDWSPQIDFSSRIGEVILGLVSEIGPQRHEEVFAESPSSVVEAEPVAEVEPVVKVEESTFASDDKALSEISVSSQPELKPLDKNFESAPELGSKHKFSWRQLNRRQKLLLDLIVIILILLLPFAGFIFTSYRGITQLERAMDALQAGDTTKAIEQASRAQTNLKRSRSIVGWLRPLAFAFPSYPEKYDRILDAASRVGGIIELSGQTTAQLSDLYSYTISGEPAIDVEQTSEEARVNLEDLYNRLGLVVAGLERIEFNSSLDHINRLVELKRDLPGWQKTIQTGLHLMDVWPDLVSGTAPKQILIVIQNNGELRPTGGFIDGIALASFRNGSLVNLDFQDTYALDSKLQGFVAPPALLEKYLGESSWFLRDANWDPDFSRSAEQIAWFYEKETGIKADAVIGVNLSTLTSVLEVTGPITLDSRKETVSAVNLTDKLLFLSNAETDKEASNYPTLELFQIFGEKLSQGQVSLPALASILGKSVTNDQIQFFARDRDLQLKLERLNWTGSISAKPCYSQFAEAGCVAETFALNEANIGINKVNFLLDRSLNQQVSIDEQGRLEHTIEVEYRNLSSTSSWPGGDYRALVRFYAPAGSQVEQISLNGLPIGMEESVLAAPGIQEHAFPLLVRVGETVQLKISLRSPNILNIQSKTSALSISWENQPGTGATPFRLTVSFPDALLAEAVNEATANKPGAVQFLTQFDQDQTAAILFKSVF
jgi:hypothetical protein